MLHVHVRDPKTGQGSTNFDEYNYLFSPPHVTAITVLFVGACAVSAAIFLVLELNRPLDGLVKVSNGPLWTALQHLGQ